MSSASGSINPNKLFHVEAALVLVFITAMEITNTPGKCHMLILLVLRRQRKETQRFSIILGYAMSLRQAWARPWLPFFFFFKKTLSLHEGMKTAEQGIMWPKHTSPYYTGKSIL